MVMVRVFDNNVLPDVLVPVQVYECVPVDIFVSVIVFEAEVPNTVAPSMKV
jgi:hypothetical protein